MTQPNPFAPFVARMDHLVPLLEKGGMSEVETAELVDLIRRAMYALVNHINSQATYMASLILDPAPEPDTEDTEGTSLERPETPDSEVSSTT